MRIPPLVFSGRSRIWRHAQSEHQRGPARTVGFTEGKIRLPQPQHFDRARSGGGEGEAAGLRPGSTLVPSVGFGVPPKRTFPDIRCELRCAVPAIRAGGSSRRRDAFANTRDAYAPRNLQPRLLPIHDAHMHRGVAAPDLRGDGVGDDAAVFHNVIEARLAAFVLAHGVRADEARASPGGHRIVREAEPVRAEIRHLRHAGEARVEPLRVLVPVLFGEVARAEIRRIADDRVRLRPRRKERVGADDLAVEIVERERFFRQVQAVGFLDLRG